MLEHITLDTARELDIFVTNHPRGHYMQTSAYGLSRPDYHWDALLLRDDLGLIRASIALHSRRVRFTGKKLYYAPRGPVWRSFEDFRDIMAAAKAFCAQNGGYVLRIDPPVPSSDGLFIQTALELGIHFDCRNDYSTFQPRNVYQLPLDGRKEEIFQRFHPKTRYNIRLAQRRGVQVRRCGASELAVFHAMMEETAQRDGFQARSADFFQSLLNAFQDKAHLLLAEKDGAILAGAIEIILGGKAWYAYGCSFDKGRENQANALLQWEMILRALDAGCYLYDLRGVEGLPEESSPGYGLHKFKQGFGAQLVQYVGQLDLPLCWQCRSIQLLQKIYSKSGILFKSPLQNL